MPVKDEVGKKYGRLQVISRAISFNGKATWFCSCSCGGVHIASGDSLRTGKVKSCGCYRMSGEAVKTHGQGACSRGVSPTYKSWQEMKGRCDNPRHTSYSNYGGRGITYVPEWSKFEQFFADMGARPPGMSLDRIDNLLGYSKDNCKWSDRVEQNNNRRNVQLIEYRGQRRSLTEWCRELDIPYPRTRRRFVEKRESFESAIMPRRKPGIQK